MGTSLETASSAADAISTEELMESIRKNLRRRYLHDIKVNPLEGARSRLQAALDTTATYRPLLSELVDEFDWEIRPAIRFRSHRPVIGDALILIKRRIVLPVVYWLYEYCSENFRAQRRINDGLMILIETLAQENARLRLDMERMLEILDSESAQPDTSRESSSDYLE